MTSTRRTWKAFARLSCNSMQVAATLIRLPKAEFWTDVDGAKILSVLKAFRFPEAHPDLGRISADASLMQDYVSDRLNADLAKWDVAIPHPAGGTNDPDVLPGHSFPLRTRESGDIDKAVNLQDHRFKKPRGGSRRRATRPFRPSAERSNGRKGKGRRLQRRSRLLRTADEAATDHPPVQEQR